MHLGDDNRPLERFDVRDAAVAQLDQRHSSEIARRGRLGGAACRVLWAGVRL
jgi:hypothetical protein